MIVGFGSLDFEKAVQYVSHNESDQITCELSLLKSQKHFSETRPTRGTGLREESTESDLNKQEEAMKMGKRVTRKVWDKNEMKVLRNIFAGYLCKRVTSVHNYDLRKAAEQLPGRSLPQIRAKLNNIRLGKCT